MKSLRNDQRRESDTASPGLAKARKAVGVVLLCFSAAVGCLFHPIDLSMHRVVEGVTYGPDAPVPQVDHELYLYALLKPTLVRKFLDCPDAVTLIGKELNAEFGWRDFTQLGRDLNKTSTPEQWASRLVSSPDSSFSKGDPMVPLAVGEAASQFAGYLRELGLEDNEAPSPTAELLQEQVERAGKTALLRILEQTCASAPKVDGPSLALSGGAANGAFIAGFMYELLMARELTWRAIQGTAEKKAFLDSSRFSGVAGASVGSLIAQVLDLYAIENFRGSNAAAVQFANDKVTLGEVAYEKENRPPSWVELNEFVKQVPVGDAELARQWALVKLFEHFTDIAEPEAICVQPGPASRLLGYPGSAVPGLMRFDPLQHEVIDPLLEAAGAATVENGFPRIAVSVEVSQNVAVGLDDTACSGAGFDLNNCLAAGIMASTVLPFFAQPVNRVRTGLTSQEDCGIWLDGGLRSGFPIQRALPLSRPSDRSSGSPRLRTLAISTSRSTGLPSSKTGDTLLDIAKEAIGEMGDQVQVGEALASSHFVLLQQERWDELVRLMTTRTSPAPVAGEIASESKPAESKVARAVLLEQNPHIEVVFVSRDVPDAFVAGAGYRFDPLVMRGLFVSGQLEAIRRGKQNLVTRLGWLKGPDVLSKLTWHESKLKEWIVRTSCVCTKGAETRKKVGQERFEARVPLCLDAPTASMRPGPGGPEEAPRYFGGDSKSCRRLTGED